ncbi:MAG: ABC transporter permease subunit [Gammaproteobacteria bacterium]|nr:ABC transporter permease subunit [Gammaproteobacteria bacterium]
MTEKLFTMRGASFLFVAIAAACFVVADVSIDTLDPWREFARMLSGVFNPDFATVENVFDALAKTVAFAFLGVALGSACGFGLSLIFHLRVVRFSCAFVRAIHELFWALIFLQAFGLHPLAGLLAIALPYAGTFAKVYAEIMEEGDRRPLESVPADTSGISAFLFARLPDAWPHLKTYTLYRLECGLRSSAILGFVGLPTLGYYLHSAFMEGIYQEVAALLFLFFGLIATIRWWVRPKLLPVYLGIAPFLLGGGGAINLDNVVRFLTSDIVPAPLRTGGSSTDLWVWTSDLLMNQALPGLVNTVVLTQIALVVTGVVALAAFPIISSQFFGRIGRSFGHLVLVVVRSTPEYILAFVFLQLWGPSMLPAIVALALHNGAIIGHLLGRYTDELPLRLDRAAGLDLYGYEIVPRIYGQFLAFMFYRWEIIMRETAILGILGIATLGFYVDSAIQDIRLDRAMVLILITAILNISIDALSRVIRARLRLKTTPECT